MLAGVLADNAEVYQSAWMMVNPEGSEYVLEDKLMQWIRLVMKSSSIVDSEEENVDYQRIIKEYVKEKHSLDSGNVASIEFTFGQAVDFLKWYGNYKQRTHKQHEK